jgi:hypothetical protein
MAGNRTQIQTNKHTHNQYINMLRSSCLYFAHLIVYVLVLHILSLSLSLCLSSLRHTASLPQQPQPTINNHGVFATMVFAQTCNGTIELTASSTPNILTDGSDPTENYLNSRDCRWIVCTSIQNQTGFVVRLAFSRFDVEEGWDFVKTYDGPTIHDNLLGLLTGNNIPAEILGSDSCLTVQFTSDGGVTEKGWELSYSMASVNCPAGYYCDPYESGSNKTICPPGTYCPKWSVNPVVCPVGSYCSSSGMETPEPCPPGFYCPSTGTVNATEAVICPAGSFCLQGSISPLQCTPGSHCPSDGLSLPIPCPSGVYCPSPGTVNTTEAITCPVGSFCLQGSPSATPCPGGSYCPIDGLSIPTPCPSGVYCPITRMMSTDTAVPCPPDMLCPAGSHYPLGHRCSLDASTCWLAGRSVPRFGTSIVLTSTANGAELAIPADLNSDGLVDVISASRYDSTVAWFRNMGDGEFSSKIVITSDAKSARFVFAIDIDGDSDLDVIVASGGDDTIAWFENDDGKGTSFTRHIISNTTDYAQAVYAVDIDQDGDTDVLSASARDDTIAWFENQDGKGVNFTKHVISNTADGAWHVYAGDIDGDSLPDVLSASTEDDTVAWYKNHGDGSFSEKRIISSSIDGAWFARLADLDGDGDLDVVAVAPRGNIVSWYENVDGAGTFAPKRIITDSVNSPTYVDIKDCDGDGDLDAIVSSSGDNTVAWYENVDGSGSFQNRHIITTTADYAQSVHVVDLDNDGDLDCLVASEGDQTIGWFQNLLQRGRFGSSSSITANLTYATSVVAADIDNDGDIDVVSTSSGDNTVAWYRNDGTGSFSDAITVSKVAEGAQSAFIIDVDGDGNVDIVSASANDKKIAWYTNIDGKGNFSGEHIISIDADGARSVFCIDIDGDGDTDCLSASVNDNKVVWYENVFGNGTVFVPHIISDTAIGARSVFAADINSDSKIDVLVASAKDDTVAWYENVDGGGTNWTRHVVSVTTDYPVSAIAVDIDGDNDLDIVAVSAFDDTVGWYRNDGTGTFSSVLIVTRTADSAWDISPADFDGDGDIDLLVSSYDDSTLAWFENLDGAGTFSSYHIISDLVESAWGVFAADLDSDGDPDALVVNFIGGQISWFANDLLYPTHAVVSALPTASRDCASFPDVVPCIGLAQSLEASTSRPGSAAIMHVQGGTHYLAERHKAIFGPRQARVLLPEEGVTIKFAYAQSPISDPLASSLTIQVLSVLSAPHTIEGGTLTIDNQLSGGSRALHITTPNSGSYDPDFVAGRIDSHLRILHSHASAGDGGGVLITGNAHVKLNRVSMEDCSTAGSGSGGCLALTSGSIVSVRNISLSRCIAAQHGGGILVQELGSHVNIDTLQASDCHATNGCGGIISIRNTGTVTSDVYASSAVHEAVLANASSTSAADHGSLFCVSTSKLAVSKCTFSYDPTWSEGYYFASNLGSIRVSSSCLPQNTPSFKTLAISPGIAAVDDRSNGDQVAQCRLGSIFDTAGAVVCSPCIAGQFQSVNLTSCMDCEPGRFTSSYGATQCMNCTAGYVTSIQGSVSCSACPAGQFADASIGASTCQKCPVGTFNENEGKTVCRNCEAGSSTSSRGGSVQCSACPAGRFHNLTTLECQPCPVGYVSPTDGRVSCKACSPGQFSSLNGSVGCVDCPSGRYTNTHGASTCTPCPKHNLAASSGATFCSDCTTETPYSFADRVGSQFCQQCDKSQYLVFTNRSDTATFKGCLPCPANTDCSSGVPQPETRYWVDINTKGIATVFPCSNPNACPGSGGCGDNRLPPDGNLLCAACLPGYQESAGECVTCEATNGGAVFGLIVLMFALVQLFFFLSQGSGGFIVVLVYFVQTVVLFVDSQTNSGAATLLSIFDMDALSMSSGSTCVIRMSDHVRVISGLFGPMMAFVCWAVLYAVWALLYRHGIATKLCEPNRDPNFRTESTRNLPGVVRRLSSSPEYQNTPIIPGMTCCTRLCQVKCLWFLQGCYMRPASRKYRKLSWRTVVVSKGRVPSQHQMTLGTRWLRTLLALFALTFNKVTRTAFSVFNCIDVSTRGEEHQVLEAYPTVECHGSAYHSITAFSAIICTFYLAVPIALVVAFPRTLLPIRHIFGKSHRYAQGEDASDSAKYILGALTAPYRGHAAWWKLSVLIRRLVLVLVVVFTEDHGWRMVAASIVCIVVLLLHILSVPFLHWIDNVMEAVSLVALTVIATVLVQMKPPYDSSERSVLGAVWGIPFLIITLWAIVGWIMHRGACKRLTSIAVQQRLIDTCAESEEVKSDMTLVHMASNSSSLSVHDRRMTVTRRGILERQTSAKALVDTPRIELSRVGPGGPGPDTSADVDRGSRSDSVSTSSSNCSDSQSVATAHDETLDLPAGWSAHVDDATGIPYYSSCVTGQVQWERPC